MEKGSFLVVWLQLGAALLSVGANPFSYVTGPFTINYDATQAPTLRVTLGDSVVWYTSSTNRTFVTAARVEQSVRQDGGTFVFSTAVQDVCSEMKIISHGSRASSNSIHKQVRLLASRVSVHGLASET